MPPLVQFLFRRLLSIPVTLLLMTAVLYGLTMATPPKVRAVLYLSKTERLRGDLWSLTDRVVQERGLMDPYPVQYARWLSRLMRGDWGWSPTLRDEVLDALIRRTPATVELTLYSLLVFIPLSLASGALAGGQNRRWPDYAFRAATFVGMGLPQFVLGLVLLAVFYAGLRWFPINRLGTAAGLVVRSDSFRSFTGLVTVDGLLNGRPDVSLDAVRHLVLPVVTLGLAHWAILGRITRAAIIDELHKDYVIAARARGVRQSAVLWRHAFLNAASPTLTATTLTASSLLTGVFVVEIIFNLHGVSEIAAAWIRNPTLQLAIPDTPAILGFAVYSTLVVQLLMLALDVFQASLDPRYREGIGA